MARAQGVPVTFSAMGDIPYSSSEVSILQRQVRDHNKYSPSLLMFHVGDIKSSSSSCGESSYRDMAGYLKVLAVPTYLVPGDNEWNDCSNPSHAWDYWTEHLGDFEQNFCGSPPTERQTARHENFAFVKSGVLFVGINLVGGSPISSSEWNTRLDQDADWVDAQLLAHDVSVRAAVVLGHAGPGGNHDRFFDPFREAAARFGKPILYLHGDGHSWRFDRPWSEQNLRRIQVASGAAEDPVQITVGLDAQNPWSVKRDPFSGNPSVVNMAPCVDVGPDRSVPLQGSLPLSAKATDDGDPTNPGTLSLAWTKVSGPGTAQFTSASARTTSVSFGAGGTYVLRLTASDGALQTSDELSVTVVGGPELSIADATVTEADAGTSDAIFTVNLTGGTGGAVSVGYATAAGSAGADTDFVPTSGTLAFSGSTTARSIVVPVRGDLHSEGTESFLVILSNPSGAAIADGSAIGTILDDESPPPTLTFLPLHDAHVYSGSANGNFGSLTTLRARDEGTDYTSYLKFDVTGLAGPVQAAVLRLYVTDESPDGGTLYLVSNHYRSTSTPWVESGLTWNTAPTIGTTPAGPAPGPAPLDRWLEFDVTGAIGGDGTYSFALESGSSNSVMYSSSEGAHPPELVVTSSITLPVEDEVEGIPSRLTLRIYPNPSRGPMSFAFAAPREGIVRLMIYDVRGREVRHMARAVGRPGPGTLDWDARDEGARVVPAGVYLYRLQLGTEQRVGRVVILR